MTELNSGEFSKSLAEIREQLAHVCAVIFDMDGLMIDSEPFHAKAFNRVFQKFGKTLTEEENAKYYVGISDKDAAEDMVQRYHLPISPEQLVHEKQASYGELLEHITAQPGLNDLLQNLQAAGFKKAIASSSMRTEIEAVMRALTIQNFIDDYCSAQEVEHGKPAPDIFLYAANKLGVDPSQCLVLEDAPSGIKAAEAAGMFRFAIPSKETQAKDFSNATLRLESLAEVFSYLSPKV